MGEVFRAEDLKLRRPVALKVLRGAEDQEGRLLREARFASQLNHPNIAVVYDVDTVEREGRRQSFIAMEYVAGRTLSALLKERAPAARPGVRSVRTRRAPRRVRCSEPSRTCPLNKRSAETSTRSLHL
jgi:serine/threonine protein kinase